MIRVARHAETLANGICFGRADVPCALDEATVAERILRALPCVPSRVWSSPSARCRGPAEVVAQRLDRELSIDARLYELDFGTWEARPWDALQIEDGARLSAWMADWQRVAPPEGETLAALEKRVHEWIASLDDEEHLVIGHAGPIRAMRVLLDGQSWDDAMRAPVPHVELFAFDQRASAKQRTPTPG